MEDTSPLCFTFEWKNQSEGTKEVIVTGDFDQWSKNIKLDFKRDKNKFNKTIKFTRQPENGTIFFKFIVDGDWMTSPAYKVDGSHPSNNYIEISELEPYDELKRVTSVSDTVCSDFTTISAPSLEEQVSPPVMVEQPNNDTVSMANSEATLTSTPNGGNMSVNSAARPPSSRGSQTIISRFKSMFK